VVDSKFEISWDGWCSVEPLGACVVGLWKNIGRGWRKFSSHTRFEAVDGSKVKFWHDLWCGDKAFKEAFPYFYGIACAKDALVALSWSFMVVIFSGM
jgi:hypothetical protein